MRRFFYRGNILRIAALSLAVCAALIISDGSSSAFDTYNSLTASCTGWPSPKVNLSWTLQDNPAVNSIEKGDVPTATFWGFVPHCGGNPNCWHGMPALGLSQTSYTDTHIVAGTTYAWRIKHDADARSNSIGFTIDSCTCGGPCPPVDDADYQSKSHPASVAPGEAFTIVFQYRNNGTADWTAPAYQFAPTDPANVAFWNLGAPVPIGSGMAGTTVIYSVSATAPAAAGTFGVSPWRHDHSGVVFGESTPPFSIAVNRLPDGEVTAMTCAEGITGWSQDPDEPGGAVAYRIYRDGAAPCPSCLVAAGSADASAPGPGGHGFLWPVPETFHDGAPHTYFIYAQDLQFPAQWKLLGGSGSALTCHPAPTATVTGHQFCSAGFGTVTWDYQSSSGEPQSEYRIQVSSEGTFAAPLYDSGRTAGTSPTVTVGQLLQPGTYRYVRAMVWDAAGEESDWSVPYGFFTPARVGFSVTPAVPAAGQPFTVEDTSNYGGAAAVAQAWEFGDGAVASGPQASHTYGDDGERTIVLTVTDSNGQTCAAVEVVTVNRPIPEVKEVLPQ
ncbi:MAG TPA: PKD domain-containing protein [Candidatus Paceibacterota bacterium]|nr:PKD domain-containing protein [Candidatus Paceibacterota bacterium]